jgi:hypothetical protein
MSRGGIKIKELEGKSIEEALHGEDIAPFYKEGCSTHYSRKPGKHEPSV